MTYFIFGVGRYEDSLGSFKQQGFHKVGKRWIPLGNSNRQASGSSPHKENVQKGPKALLMFYFGEKQAGTQAMEAEMSKGGISHQNISDEQLGGTPSILPFGDYINGAQSTPLRDRDPH